VQRAGDNRLATSRVSRCEMTPAEDMLRQIGVCRSFKLNLLRLAHISVSNLGPCAPASTIAAPVEMPNESFGIFPAWPCSAANAVGGCTRYD